MSEEKRVRRTPEQIAADLDVQIEKLKDSILELENKKAASVTEFDNKIAAVKEKIAKLEAKKKDVLTPKKRKPRKSKADQIKLLVRQAQKSGMKLDEIADKVDFAAFTDEKFGYKTPLSYEEWLEENHYHKIDKAVAERLYAQELAYLEANKKRTLKEITTRRIAEFKAAVGKYVGL